FNLNIPIFDGFYKQSKISQARLKFEMDKNTFDATLNAMMMEVEQAKLNVRIQSNNLRNQIDSRALAKSIYQTTKTKFEAGMSSSFELIQAQNDLSRADIDHSNALYQLIVAQIELETALGSSNK
ncbi:MAG: outer membrane protein, partial [Bacteroidia bacterium]